MKKTNKRRFSLIFSILLLCFSGNIIKAIPPSQKLVDSLKQVLSKTKDPIRKADILNQLSQAEQERGGKKNSMNYAKEAYSSAAEQNYDKGRAKALLNIGIAETAMENYDAAKNHFNRSFSLAYKIKDLILQGEVYDNLGLLYEELNEEEKALQTHKKALFIHRSAKNEKGIANSCMNVAAVYWVLDDYVKTIPYYEEALPIFKKLNDNKNVAEVLADLGICYKSMGDYSKAIDYYIDAEKIYRKINDQDGIAFSLTSLGKLYSTAGDDKKALEYYQKALKIYEKINIPSSVAISYIYIADSYINRNQKDTALQYYKKGLEIAKKINDTQFISLAYYNIASKIYWTDNKLDETLHYLNLSDSVGYKPYLAGSWSLLAQIFNKKKEYAKAKEYVIKAIDYHKKTKEKIYLKRDYQTLSSIEENTGNYKAALENYKLYKVYEDSLKQDDISKSVIKYEFDKKETEMKARQQEEINRRKIVSNTTYGILGTLILLAVSGLYTFRLRNKKLSADKQNLELKRREAELAKETEEFKARFLSNISHEFRTPLTLINGHLEILKKEGSAKNQKRFDEMEYSGQRLLQLINQLLDLTRLEKDKYRFYYKKGNILNEAQNYIQAFYSLAEQRNISLTTEITESAKTKFSQKDFAYSSEALASIFNNLISNAIKFTPSRGNVHCKIDFRDGKLYFSVSDTGRGIPEKDLPHIFDRFYQIETKEKPIYEGSGIGLAIVKELAMLHNGDAIVDNNETCGCTFTVWLSEGQMTSDIENPEIIIPPAISNINSSAEENFEDEEKPLILVVEDQRELRKFVVENLGSQYRILEAENGKQGTELALEHLPDIVVSDVMMPEMNGFQLCQTLKENDITSHIPIILLTAKSDQTDKIEGLETGADDYLVKPFSISELALRVKNRIRQQENLRKKFVGNTIPIAEEAPELNARDRNFLEKLDKIARRNIEKESGVIELASEIGLSASQLTRKLKTLTGQTPANFVKNIKMDAALQMLKNGDSVSEAAWSVGFSDPAYFTKVFKKHFGFLPSEKDNF